MNPYLPLITKAVAASSPISSDDAQGRVTLLANTTGVVDKQRDNILPGAWAPVLHGKMPKLVVGHDHNGIPYGKVLSLAEWLPGDYRLPQWHQEHNAGALVAECQINLDTQDGRDLFSAIRGGFIDEFSVAFQCAPDGEKYAGGGVREISKIAALPEISCVLIGASLATGTLSVKSADNLPAWLRELIESEVVQAISDHEERISDQVFKTAQAIRDHVPSWMR